jgi:hypothetical protein
MSWYAMGIQDDILEDFFKKLKDAKFSRNTIRELKKLWENRELASKENIISAIKRGNEDAAKNQVH